VGGAQDPTLSLRIRQATHEEIAGSQLAVLPTGRAVVGGLLVAVAAKYNEASTALTPGQRMKPHIYFNAGRILSYTLLGGAIGALGGPYGVSTVTGCAPASHS